jgi:hypothetical protein
VTAAKPPCFFMGCGNPPSSFGELGGCAFGLAFSQSSIEVTITGFAGASCNDEDA